MISQNLLREIISEKPKFLTWLPLSHSYEHTVQFVQIAEGAKIFSNSKEVIDNSKAIIQMNILEDENLNLLKENQFLIGVLNPFLNEKKLNNLNLKKVNCFSLELLPRITRAQSMDILSSQANLAGYKAVIDSFAYFQKAIPMMMTAAGTISAAKVLVVGAGVAGLQAIATAKRMGAIVYATDVRLASKEQVESLGGKFLTVEGAENQETEGGYAKEATDDYKKVFDLDVSLYSKQLQDYSKDIYLSQDMIPMKPYYLTDKNELQTRYWQILNGQSGNLLNNVNMQNNQSYVVFRDKEKIKTLTFFVHAQPNSNYPFKNFLKTDAKYKESSYKIKL